MSKSGQIGAVAGSLLIACALCAAAASQPDYSGYDDLLLNYVHQGFVDYDGIALDGRLDDFLAQLADGSPDELRDDNQRKAFFINAYNAMAIRATDGDDSSRK